MNMVNSFPGAPISTIRYIGWIVGTVVGILIAAGLMEGRWNQSTGVARNSCYIRYNAREDAYREMEFLTSQGLESNHRRIIRIQDRLTELNEELKRDGCRS